MRSPYMANKNQKSQAQKAVSSAKNKSAKSLNIPILTEEEFSNKYLTN